MCASAFYACIFSLSLSSSCNYYTNSKKSYLECKTRNGGSSGGVDGREVIKKCAVEYDVVSVKGFSVIFGIVRLHQSLSQLDVRNLLSLFSFDMNYNK